MCIQIHIYKVECANGSLENQCKNKKTKKRMHCGKTINKIDNMDKIMFQKIS